MKDAVLHTLYKQDLNQTKINAFFNQHILIPIGEKNCFSEETKKKTHKKQGGMNEIWPTYDWACSYILLK